MKTSINKSAVKRAIKNAAATASSGAVRKEPVTHGAVRPQAEVTYQAIELCIKKIECEKTTKEIINKDKMTIAALETVTELQVQKNEKKLAAKVKKGTTLDLGKFGKGDVQQYKNGKVLASFPYGGSGAEWPRTYPAVIVLSELDDGKFGKILNQLIKEIEDDATKALSQSAVSVTSGLAAGIAVGAGIGASAGTVIPLLGSAVGATVGTGIAAAVNAIQKGRQDDCFPPKLANLTLNAAPQNAGVVGKSEKTVKFQAFGGIYHVTYYWQVV